MQSGKAADSGLELSRDNRAVNNWEVDKFCNEREETARNWLWRKRRMK